MSEQSTSNSLGRSKVFQGLDREDVERIAHRGRTSRLDVGQTLIEEGQSNVDLFVVIEGELEVFLPETPERFTKVRLARLGAGECIGEYSFVDRNPASASVEAAGATEVFRISQKEFEELLDENGTIGRVIYRNLLRLLITRLRENNKGLDIFRPIRTA